MNVQSSSLALILSLLGLSGLGGCLSTGCNSLQPNAFPKEVSVIAQQVGTAMAEKAVWDKVLARIDGQVIDPGFEGGAGVMYIAYGKLKGVSGQVKLEGDGSATTPRSPESEAFIRELANRPDLLELLIQKLATQEPVTTKPTK